MLAHKLMLSVLLVGLMKIHPSMGQGEWEEWGEYTTCTKLCGGGVQIRVRECNGTYCGEDESQTANCNSQGCPVDGGWSEYTSWSTCSEPCAGGTQTRSRSCTSPEPANGGALCEGDTDEEQACNQHGCPIDGEWSEWTEWTFCNTDCKIFRSRACDNPSPEHNGLPCVGEDTQDNECSILVCPVDGQWSEWYVHDCDTTCHGRKSRECDNPAPLRGGAWCDGPDEEEYGECAVFDCIQDGSWGSWSEWSECSKTCSYGIQTRNRECDSPRPRNGGAKCPVDDADEAERTCYEEPCPAPLKHRKMYKPKSSDDEIDWALILAIIFGSLGGLTLILLIILGVRRSQLKRMRDKAVKDRENTPLYKEAAEMSVIPVGKRSAAAKLKRQQLKKKLKKPVDDEKPKTFFDTVFQFNDFDDQRPITSLSRSNSSLSVESRPGTAAFDHPSSHNLTSKPGRVNTPMMMEGLEKIDHQLREIAEKQNTGSKDVPLITYQNDVNPTSNIVGGMSSLETLLGFPANLNATNQTRLPPISPRGLPSLDTGIDSKGILKPAGNLPPLQVTMTLKSSEKDYLQKSGQGITLDEAMDGGKSTNSKKNLPLSREEEVDEIVENFWEVPRESIEIITTLAMGSFGQVMKAKAWDLLSSKGASLVVVKELDSKASPATRKAFLNELDVLKKLDTHSNVISLLGCCTILDPLYMVFEYAPKGELQTFLRRNRPHTPGAKPPMSKNLMNFAIQVAKGMAYLHKNKVIHGELTSGNILLGDRMICKVSNVARVRNVIENVAECRLGLRWMSPESICASIQNEQSDAWSFGILLWEIVNFGSTPYPTMSEKDIKARVKVGHRMPQPPHCTKDLYNLMMYCWNDVPEKRPPLKALASTLWKMNVEGIEHIHVKDFDSKLCVDMDDLRPHTPGSISC